jgi:hypothetical protein
LPRLASAPDTAVWCAEQFVARNGYTDRPAVADTSLLASESFELSSSAAEMLRMRDNTLEPQAVGLCAPSPSEARAPTNGYIIAFRYRDTAGTMRGVTMSDRFTNLRMQHQDLNPAVLDSAHYGCRRRVLKIPIRQHN